jgi:hypothetical protein
MADPLDSGPSRSLVTRTLRLRRDLSLPYLWVLIVEQPALLLLGVREGSPSLRGELS